MALTLYRDDFLTGFTLRDSVNFEEWQFFQAEELRQELVQVLVRLTHAAGTQGDVAARGPVRAAAALSRSSTARMCNAT